MNIPRHEWNQNIKDDLLAFLKTASDHKTNKFCDDKEYRRLKALLPLNKNIKEELQIYRDKANVCIDITQSDEEGNQNYKNTKGLENNILPEDVQSIALSNFDKNNCLELADTIKESLATEKAIPKTTLNDLVLLDNAKLVQCFSYLANRFTLEDLQYVWHSFDNSNIVNDYIITHYVAVLLLPQKHGTALKNELVQEFIRTVQIDDEAPTVLLQYVAYFNNDYKTELLRDFLSTAQKLHANYIPIIECLLTTQCDVDILCKLIGVMASSSTEFCSDNTYGKLLFKVVNSCDHNITGLEQPLKRILGTHKSIWKIKVQQTVVNWFNDSLTQSFM